MNSIIELPILDPFIDVIQTFVTHQGLYAPVLLLFLEECGIPLPVPGDIFIAFVGYKVSIGNIPFLLALFSFLISVLAGATVLYFLSTRYGQQLILKFGYLIHLSEKRIDKVEEKFKKYGAWVIIFGRHIPGFRVPITFFAGSSGVPYLTFILSTLVSIMFWIPLYLEIGQKLGIKTEHLIRGHHIYFFITLIPFIIFIGSIIYLSIKQRKLKSHLK